MPLITTEFAGSLLIVHYRSSVIIVAKLDSQILNFQLIPATLGRLVTHASIYLLVIEVGAIQIFESILGSILSHAI